MPSKVKATGRLDTRAVSINFTNRDEWSVLQEQIHADDADALLILPERLVIILWFMTNDVCVILGTTVTVNDRIIEDVQAPFEHIGVQPGDLVLQNIRLLSRVASLA